MNQPRYAEPRVEQISAERDTDLSTRSRGSVRLDLNQFVLRLLQDCITEATGTYWIKRAETFEAARPKLDEFYGRADVTEMRRRWQELTEIANACRARAQLAPIADEIEEDVAAVWGEVS